MQDSMKKYCVYAVIFHAVILALLLVNLSSGGGVPKPTVINATVQQPAMHAQTVDSQALQHQINKIKSQEVAKQRAEQAKIQKMKNVEVAAKKAENQRRVEEAKVNALKVESQKKLQQQVKEEKVMQQKLASLKEEQSKQQAHLNALKHEEKMKKEKAAAAEVAQKKLVEQKAAEKKLAEVKPVEKKVEEPPVKKNTEEPVKKIETPSTVDDADASDNSDAATDVAEAKSAESKSKVASAPPAVDHQYDGVIDQYRGLITNAIQRNWIVPSTVTDKQLSCRLYIRLGPGGTVLNVSVQKSSGDDALDRSAIAAVYKASPLPVPTEAVVAEQFKELTMDVRPEEVVG